jgi:hypothetical protein
MASFLSFWDPNTPSGKHHRRVVGQCYGTSNLIISGISLGLAAWYSCEKCQLKTGSFIVGTIAICTLSISIVVSVLVLMAAPALRLV